RTLIYVRLRKVRLERWAFVDKAVDVLRLGHGGWTCRHVLAIGLDDDRRRTVRNRGRGTGELRIVITAIRGRVRRWVRRLTIRVIRLRVSVGRRRTGSILR